MPPEQYDIGSYPDQPQSYMPDISGYPDQPQQRSWWDTGAEMAISTVPSIAGSFFGPAGGAFGSAVGEMGRQMYATPDEPFNWGLIGTEASLGAIPFSKAGRGLWEGVKFGAKTGAAQAALGSPFRHYFESGELPTLGQAAVETGMGTVFGSAMGGGMHFLPQPRPRIQPGAGAENIDIGPPPPNLKQIGSGSTAPPPPIEAAPPPPPGGGTPMTDMNPYIEVSINNPKKQAELEAQGYVLVQSDGVNLKFVRKDTMNTTQGEPTPSPVQDMRAAESEFIPVSQIQQEFGVNSIEANNKGYVELFTDAKGRTGFRRTGKLPEPPVREEPPIESYDNEQIARGETPFTPAKNPLTPLDIPLSEGEVEAKYRMSVDQAVHEGIVERVVQNGETGYLEIGEIGGFRHIGDPRPPTAGNETPNEQEIRAYLSRMLGRPATDDEVARAIDRQARTGEFTGRVAPFPPPEILAMRQDDLLNQPELPGFLREGNVGEPGLRFEDFTAELFNPNVNDVGPSGPRTALQGFDEPRMGQQDLPFGAIGSIRPKKSIWDKTLQEADYEGAFSPGGELNRTPRLQPPEGPLPQQLGLGIDPGGGKPVPTDMEISMDPATGKRIRPISGGSGRREPEWYNHSDRIGKIVDKSQAREVEIYWHKKAMDAWDRGDRINAENYKTLADLADERYYHLRDNPQLPPGHTDVGGVRNIDLNQAMKINEPEMRMRKGFDKKHNTGSAYLDRQLNWIKEVAQDHDAGIDDFYNARDMLSDIDDHELLPPEAKAAIPDMIKMFQDRIDRRIAEVNARPDQARGSQPPTPDELAESRRGRKLEDLADELFEALESKGAIPSPGSVLNILRHINGAKDTGEALRNLTDIRAFADSATTPLQKEIFEDIYKRAQAKYYETIQTTQPRMPRSSEDATAAADDAFGRADELIDDGKVSEADKLIADEVTRLNNAGFASHAQELAADWNNHVDNYFTRVGEVNKGFQDEFNNSFKRWEQEQKQPYNQGQLDLPLGKYEPGMPRGFEIPTQKPRNELGQFITAAEAAKQQQDIPGLVSRSGVKARPETIVTPGIRGGSGEGEVPIHPSRIVEINAPRPGDPPRQPPGNVPPESVTPGSRPPPPDEPPASAKKTPWSDKSFWEQAYDAVRNLTTGLDISAPMRQGLPLIATKSWWTSWGSMLKAWGSQAAYDANQKSITDHYLFKPRELPNGKTIQGFGQRMGLRIIDEIDHVEEVTASKWVEKHFPGFKASNRAYNAFLNKLRADTFTNLIEDADRLGKNPYNDETLAREIAEFVNTATGAASIKLDVPAWMSRSRQVSFEQSAKTLGYLLFSPRQTFSRARMLNPLTYSNANPYVRKQYMKAMVASASAWSVIAGAAKMSGYADEVSLDPTSADFGKIRIGKTRLDVGGGFQQYLVATARLLSGQRTTAASSGGQGRTQVLGEGYQARTGLDVAQMFISNKLHPLTKFGYDFLAASEYQPFQVGDKIAQIVIPLYMQDAYEIITQQRPEILPLLFPAAIGMGTQTYEAGEATSRIVPPAYDYKYTGGERPLSDMWRR